MPRHGRSALYLSIFFLLFAAPLFAIHFSLLNLPYFWDELGQFIPTALDLLRDGAWVAHSTLPNIHPPGVEAYLVLWYKLFGYSIPITRVAMLAVAASGLLILFLLSIELSRDAPGVPAFLPPFLMLASPLFYTQSMMAQLDMPAMVFTLLALGLVDRVGRRALMLFGAAGIGVSHLLLGITYRAGVKGLPILLLTLCTIGFYALSLAPVTWVLISELFPNRVRGLGVSVAVSALWIASFVLTFTFPILQRALGSAGTFWTYAGICFAGFVFVRVTVPETSGKTLEEIERELG